MKSNGTIALANDPFAIVLCVGMNEEDKSRVRRILWEPGARFSPVRWLVVSRTTTTAALSFLREFSIPIVICDCDITHDAWLEMLDLVSTLPDPPLVIPTSRLDGESLWAEALNLGAYDVLAKPFDAAEVRRILALAWEQWKGRHTIHSRRSVQRRAAAG